jgi:hypothetical protein
LGVYSRRGKGYGEGEEMGREYDNGEQMEEMFVSSCVL